MELDKKIETAQLFLIYQDLLTDKQKKYIEMYLLEYFSLGEIAASENVSRNAVFDQIKKTIAIINNFEEKLEINKKNIEREEIILKLEENFSKDLLEKLKNIK
jgi:predicted DNA-binding protein YlxM (UPF0122 family)